MPKRFYVAWALAVILALVLPVAIPNWIWPPDVHASGCNSQTVGPFSADFMYRGPYGIPLGNPSGCGDVKPASAFARVLVTGGGLVGYMAGVLAVSLPFWRLQERRRTGRDRSHWFLDLPVPG